MKPTKLTKIKKSISLYKLYLFISITVLGFSVANAQETIDVGETGWDVKKPVFAGACEAGCPWGELADFVQEAMEPYGYSVLICRNCNRIHGARIVSNNEYPPELDEANLEDGTIFRLNARVDFGVTSSAFLADSYNSSFGGGPYKNLRLIAKVEDPFYFLVASREESEITSIEQIVQQHLPVRIFDADGSISILLKSYGVTADDINAWGGNARVSMEDALNGDFDIMGGFLASPSNNIESSYWTTLSEKFDLYFWELPKQELELIKNVNVDSEYIEVQNDLLNGVNRRIKTLGRSGEAFFARDDTPEQAAYDIAKAIDTNRGSLKWFIRIYTYDSNTVWSNFGVPLHPGAERYYREVGYMK